MDQRRNLYRRGLPLPSLTQQNASGDLTSASLYHKSGTNSPLRAPMQRYVHPPENANAEGSLNEETSASKQSTTLLYSHELSISAQKSSHARDIGEYLSSKRDKVNIQLAQAPIAGPLAHAIAHSHMSHMAMDHAPSTTSHSLGTDRDDRISHQDEASTLPAWFVPLASTLTPTPWIPQNLLNEPLSSLFAIPCTSLFAGLVFWLNGHMTPSASILRVLIPAHGGQVLLHDTPAVTHIVAEVLPLSKVATLGSTRRKPWVITGGWVAACVSRWEAWRAALQATHVSDDSSGDSSPTESLGVAVRISADTMRWLRAPERLWLAQCVRDTYSQPAALFRDPGTAVPSARCSVIEKAAGVGAGAAGHPAVGLQTWVGQGGNVWASMPKPAPVGSVVAQLPDRQLRKPDSPPLVAAPAQPPGGIPAIPPLIPPLIPTVPALSAPPPLITAVQPALHSAPPPAYSPLPPAAPAFAPLTEPPTAPTVPSAVVPVAPPPASVQPRAGLYRSRRTHAHQRGDGDTPGPQPNDASRFPSLTPAPPAAIAQRRGATVTATAMDSAAAVASYLSASRLHVLTQWRDAVLPRVAAAWRTALAAEATEPHPALRALHVPAMDSAESADATHVPVSADFDVGVLPAPVPMSSGSAPAKPDAAGVRWPQCVRSPLRPLIERCLRRALAPRRESAAVSSAPHEPSLPLPPQLPPPPLLLPSHTLFVPLALLCPLARDAAPPPRPPPQCARAQGLLHPGLRSIASVSGQSSLCARALAGVPDDGRGEEIAREEGTDEDDALVVCACGALSVRCAAVRVAGHAEPVPGVFVCACVLAQFPCPRLDDPDTLWPRTTEGAASVAPPLSTPPQASDNASGAASAEDAVWLHVDMDAFFLSAAIAAARARWSQHFVHHTRHVDHDNAPAASIASRSGAVLAAWSYAGYSPSWHDWLPLRPLLVAHGTGRRSEDDASHTVPGVHPWSAALYDATCVDAAPDIEWLSQLAQLQPNDVLTGTCLPSTATPAPESGDTLAAPHKECLRRPPASAECASRVLGAALAAATEQSAQSTSSVSSSNALARALHVRTDWGLVHAHTAAREALAALASPSAMVPTPPSPLAVFPYALDAYPALASGFFLCLSALAARVCPISMDEALVAAHPHQLTAAAGLFCSWLRTHMRASGWTLPADAHADTPSASAAAPHVSLSTPPPVPEQPELPPLAWATQWFAALVRATVLAHTHCPSSVGAAPEPHAATVATQLAKRRYTAAPHLPPEAASRSSAATAPSGTPTVPAVPRLPLLGDPLARVSLFLPAAYAQHPCHLFPHIFAQPPRDTHATEIPQPSATPIAVLTDTTHSNATGESSASATCSATQTAPLTDTAGVCVAALSPDALRAYHALLLAHVTPLRHASAAPRHPRATIPGIPRPALAAFLAPLPVGDLPGVGRQTRRALEPLGLLLCADLQRIAVAEALGPGAPPRALVADGDVLGEVWAQRSQLLMRGRALRAAVGEKAAMALLQASVGVHEKSKGVDMPLYAPQQPHPQHDTPAVVPALCGLGVYLHALQSAATVQDCSAVAHGFATHTLSLPPALCRVLLSRYPLAPPQLPKAAPHSRARALLTAALPGLPRSCSVDINYALRPTSWAQLRDICGAVVASLVTKLRTIALNAFDVAAWSDDAAFAGGYLCCGALSVGVMVRAPHAGEPGKYLGHGDCTRGTKTLRQLLALRVAEADGENDNSTTEAEGGADTVSLVRVLREGAGKASGAMSRRAWESWVRDSVLAAVCTLLGSAAGVDAAALEAEIQAGATGPPPRAPRGNPAYAPHWRCMYTQLRGLTVQAMSLMVVRGGAREDAAVRSCVADNASMSLLLSMCERKGGLTTLLSHGAQLSAGSRSDGLSVYVNVDAASASAPVAAASGGAVWGRTAYKRPMRNAGEVNVERGTAPRAKRTRAGLCDGSPRAHRSGFHSDTQASDDLCAVSVVDLALSEGDMTAAAAEANTALPGKNNPTHAVITSVAPTPDHVPIFARAFAATPTAPPFSSLVLLWRTLPAVTALLQPTLALAHTHVQHLVTTATSAFLCARPHESPTHVLFGTLHSIVWPPLAPIASLAAVVAQLHRDHMPRCSTRPSAPTTHECPLCVELQSFVQALFTHLRSTLACLRAAGEALAHARDTECECELSHGGLNCDRSSPALTLYIVADLEGAPAVHGERTYSGPQALAALITALTKQTSHTRCTLALSPQLGCSPQPLGRTATPPFSTVMHTSVCYSCARKTVSDALFERGILLTETLQLLREWVPVTRRVLVAEPIL